MIHSLAIKGNIEPHKEDPKTSTDFENLLLFPDKEFRKILRSAFQDNNDL